MGSSSPRTQKCCVPSGGCVHRVSISRVFLEEKVVSPCPPPRSQDPLPLPLHAAGDTQGCSRFLLDGAVVFILLGLILHPLVVWEEVLAFPIVRLQDSFGWPGRWGDMLRWGLQVLVGKLLPLLLEKAARGGPISVMLS